MVRHSVVVGLVLWLSPSLLCAQGAEFSINTPSANLYTSPSTGGPVIGTAPRGTVLDVTRELGSWVRIAWPEAPDGVAYVHVSSISKTRASDQSQASTFAPPRSTPAPAPRATTVVRVARPEGGAQSTSSSRTVYVFQPSHVVGLGGSIAGPTLGLGASARGWSHKRFGVQLEVSRSALTSIGAAGQVTSMQLTPSVLYAVADRVTDFIWVRPYLGAGAGLHRQTFAIPGATESVSDSSLGVRAFGGSEFTFPTVPRFAVSVDFGYRWLRTPFPGLELGGTGVSVSGHWYTR